MAAINVQAQRQKLARLVAKVIGQGWGHFENHRFGIVCFCVDCTHAQCVVAAHKPMPKMALSARISAPLMACESSEAKNSSTLAMFSGKVARPFGLVLGSNMR